MKAKVILITGQLGLNKKEMLEKFVRHLSEKAGETRECHCVFFEDKLIEAYNEEMGYKSPDETASLSIILGNPKSLLFKVWKPAAEKVQKEISENSNKDFVLVVMHATYYHLDTRSFSTFYNIWDIKAYFQPSQVVILVDDIVDIKNRRKGFFLSSDLAEEIFWLMIILIWREFEMNASVSIANHIGCRFSVLALRHKLQTLEDLLDDKESVYLSHSITEVKERLLNNEDVFTGTELIQEVNELYEDLTNSGIVTFSPTTIDDLRFFRVLIDGEEISLPLIIPRWPGFDEEETLWTKPASNEVFKNQPDFDLKIPDTLRDRLNNDWSAAEEVRSIIQKNAKENETYAVQLKGMGNLIKPLITLIAEQIYSRDITLVSQASNIAAYRPIFAGNLASGVEEEIRCFNKLRKIYASEYGKCFCFVSEKDIGNYPQRRLAFLAKGNVVFENEPSQETLEKFTSEQFKKIETWDGFVEFASKKEYNINVLDVQERGKQGVVKGSKYGRREEKWSGFVSEAKDWKYFLLGKDDIEVSMLVEEGGAPKGFCKKIVSEL